MFIETNEKHKTILSLLFDEVNKWVLFFHIKYILYETLIAVENDSLYWVNKLYDCIYRSSGELLRVFVFCLHIYLFKLGIYDVRSLSKPGVLTGVSDMGQK